MTGRRSSALRALGVAGIAMVVAGCSSAPSASPVTSLPPATSLVPVTSVAPGTAAASDAEVAAMTCTALREVNNRIVTVVNESVADIGATASDERLAPVVEGLAEVRAEVLAWDREVDRLGLPDTDEGRMLAEQLHAGVEDAVDELDQQSAELEPTATIADDEVGGFVGAWFNSIEKVVSSLEPEIFRFERRAFKQAFLDDPSCRNVIQQFVND